MSRWKRFPTAIISPVAVVVLGLMLSGCVTTESKWTHAEIPADEWSADAAQCKWDARRKAEREVEDTLAYTSDDTFDGSQNIDSMLATADINKRSRVLFSRCMRSLGYVAAD